MPTRFPTTARLMTLGMVASFGLAAACTGNLEPDENAEEGMIPTEVTSESEGEVDPIDAGAPAAVAVPDTQTGPMETTTSPDAALPMPESETGAGAEPGMPIKEAEDVPANRPTEGGGGY